MTMPAPKFVTPFTFYPIFKRRRIPVSLIDDSISLYRLNDLKQRKVPSRKNCFTCPKVQVAFNYVSVVGAGLDRQKVLKLLQKRTRRLSRHDR